MISFQQWIQAPQTHWLRKLVFQIHLWLGIGLGLYVLAISLSGSALLLKWPFYGWFEPKYVVPTDDIPLEGEALTKKMAEVYEGYQLGFTTTASEPTDATYIVLQKDGEYIPHYFNQYTGEDIGPAHPWQIKSIQWLADVHDDLLIGDKGVKINGVGGVLFVLMTITGFMIWWQGRKRWHEGLMIKRQSNRLFIWQLHSFIGFWSLFLMFAWGVSAIQIGFPEYIYPVIERLRNSSMVHFARYGEGTWANWLWITASFIPTLLFISGFILWWKRVILKQKRAE